MVKLFRKSVWSTFIAGHLNCGKSIGSIIFTLVILSHRQDYNKMIQSDTATVKVRGPFLQGPEVGFGQCTRLCRSIQRDNSRGHNQSRPQSNKRHNAFTATALIELTRLRRVKIKNKHDILVS